MRGSKFWLRNEKRVMKMLGFEPVSGSGNGWIHKEDGENEAALAQLKSTESGSFKLTVVDLEKLEYHAAVSNKIPVFVIEFLGRETYALVNIKDFYRLQDLTLGKKEEKREREVFETDVVVTKDKVVSATKERKKFYREEEEKWNSRNKKKRH